MRKRVGVTANSLVTAVSPNAKEHGVPLFSTFLPFSDRHSSSSSSNRSGRNGAEHLFTPLLSPSRQDKNVALQPPPPPPHLLADHLAELIHVLEQHVVVGHGPDGGELATQAAGGGARARSPPRSPHNAPPPPPATAAALNPSRLTQDRPNPP